MFLKILFLGWSNRHAALCLSTILCLVLLVSPLPSWAGDFITFDEFKELIVLEMTKANEILEEQELPRYKLTKIDVELSASSTQIASGGLKIPVLPFGANIGGEYSQLATRTESRTFVPRDSVPVGEGPDFGLVEFIVTLHQQLRADLETSPVITLQASLENVFVVGRKADAGVSFFSVLELGVTREAANTHKVKFFFCLVTDEGKCVETN